MDFSVPRNTMAAHTYNWDLLFCLPTFAITSNDFVFGESVGLVSLVSFYSDRQNKLICGFASMEPSLCRTKLVQPDVNRCLLSLSSHGSLCHCLFFHHPRIHLTTWLVCPSTWLVSQHLWLRQRCWRVTTCDRRSVFWNLVPWVPVCVSPLPLVCWKVNVFLPPILK